MEPGASPNYPRISLGGIDGYATRTVFSSRQPEWYGGVSHWTDNDYIVWTNVLPRQYGFTNANNLWISIVGCRFKSPMAGPLALYQDAIRF